MNPKSRPRTHPQPCSWKWRQRLLGDAPGFNHICYWSCHTLPPLSHTHTGTRVTVDLTQTKPGMEFNHHTNTHRETHTKKKNTSAQTHHKRATSTTAATSNQSPPLGAVPTLSALETQDAQQHMHSTQALHAETAHAIKSMCL